MRRDGLDFVHHFAGLQLVRFMCWTDYTPCFNGGFPREFIFRLHPNDPRPMGRRCLDNPNRTTSTWSTRIPMNQWIQVTGPGDDGAMPGPKGVLP